MSFSSHTKSQKIKSLSPKHAIRTKPNAKKTSKTPKMETHKPPKPLLDSHVRYIWRAFRSRRCRRRRVRSSPVEANLHRSRQFLFLIIIIIFFFFFISLFEKPYKRNGVRNHSPSLDQVLLHQESEYRVVRRGQEHRLRERLGQQSHGGVQLIVPHGPDRERPGFQLLRVLEALEELEVRKLVAAQEPSAPKRVQQVRESRRFVVGDCRRRRGRRRRRRRRRAKVGEETVPFWVRRRRGSEEAKGLGVRMVRLEVVVVVVAAWVYGEVERERERVC